MSGQYLHIDGVFELHRRGDQPTPRLLVVFSAANARNFTFYKSTSEMRPDVLYIRDPAGNAWYQEGLAEGESLDDIEARIASVAAAYREVWMLGSSMGGFAALYFGCRLGARRILALAPQIVVDGRFARGPRRATRVQTPDISELVRGATRSLITIVFGSLDLIDAYNLSRLYPEGGDLPLHFRVLQYEGQDHLLPIRLEAECTLKTFFQSILSHNTVPATTLRLTEGPPLSPGRRAVLEAYVERLLARDHEGAHRVVAAAVPDHPDWLPLRVLEVETALAAELPMAPYLDAAIALAAENGTAIDHAFLVAQIAETLGRDDLARDYLRRVFAIRTSHPPGRRMLARIEERAGPGPDGGPAPGPEAAPEPEGQPEDDAAFTAVEGSEPPPAPVSARRA